MSLFHFARLLAEEQPLTSVEILPGGSEDWPGTTKDVPFLFIDGNLGIPLKVLYKFYMAAVALYNNKNDTATLLALSSIIIFANSAHQTALNARKKLITQGELDPKKELRLVQLFIRGSKDVAKQSIIWDHRRWIFRYQYEQMGDRVKVEKAEKRGWSSEEASSLPMIPLAMLVAECELIRHGCEIYPRNYYAWTHWHWVMDVARACGYREFILEEGRRLREWIDMHVSDYSAMHHVCVLSVVDDELRGETQRHAEGLVVEYVGRESVSLYDRIAHT